MQTMTRWTDERMDGLGGKVDGLGQRLGRLEQKVEGLDQRVGRLESTVDALNHEMHAEFRALRGEIKSMQMTMIGGFVTVLATMIATQL